jgi:hypothetical protein
VGFEVKASRVWKPEYSTALNQMIESGKIQKGFGVYLGDRPLKVGAVHVYPLMTFLKKLHARHFF